MDKLGLDGAAFLFLTDSVTTIAEKLDVPKEDIRLFTFKSEGREYSGEFAVFNEKYDGLMVNTWENNNRTERIGLTFWKNQSLEDVLENARDVSE